MLWTFKTPTISFAAEQITITHFLPHSSTSSCACLIDFANLDSMRRLSSGFGVTDSGFSASACAHARSAKMSGTVRCCVVVVMDGVSGRGAYLVFATPDRPDIAASVCVSLRARYMRLSRREQYARYLAQSRRRRPYVSCWASTSDSKETDNRDISDVIRYPQERKGDTRGARHV